MKKIRMIAGLPTEFLTYAIGGVTLVFMGLGLFTATLTALIQGELDKTP